MKYTHKNIGTCSSSVSFDLEDGKIYNVSFRGGCNGNLKAIGILTEGMDAEKLVELLSGNTCGNMPTSCTDQLADGVRKALEEEKNR